MKEVFSYCEVCKKWTAHKESRVLVIGEYEEELKINFIRIIKWTLSFGILYLIDKLMYGKKKECENCGHINLED